MRKQFCALFVLLSVSLGYSQQPIYQAPNILPPSPTAAALGQYGLIPVSMATGTPNIDIPLYEFRTKNLSVPISLSYNSNGLRVDEVATWVGAGWSLNSGGVISRIVRDEPDELSYFEFPYPTTYNGLDPMFLKFIHYVGENDDADTEPDLYTFNFLGYTGKFIFDKNGMPLTMPYSNLRIQRFVDGQTNLGYFVVNTPDGVEFTFSEPELTASSNVSADTKNYNFYQTSWYLTRIEHPQGDVVTIAYDYHSSYTYGVGIVQTLTRLTGIQSCGGETPSCPTINDVTQPTGLQVVGRHISKIAASGYGSIEFDATLDRSDLNDYRLIGFKIKNPKNQVIKECQFTQITVKDRMFLTEIAEIDKTTHIVKEHAFEYEDVENIPYRLSRSQDHWGYYNGAENEDLVPKDLETRDIHGAFAFAGTGGNREPDHQFTAKGILKSIKYPAGVVSELNYQPNTIYGQKTVYPSRTTIPLSCSNETSPSAPKSCFISINSPVSQVIKLAFSVSLIFGYQNPGIGAQLNITGLGSPYSLPQNIGQTTEQYIQLSANASYTFELVSLAPGVSSSISFEYYDTAPQVTSDNIEIGGLRIAKIVNHDPITNREEEINYYYAKHDDLSKSSGVTVFEPQYKTQFFTKFNCGFSPTGGQYQCNYVSLNSNNQNNLFKTNGADVYYRYVTVARSGDFDAGYEEHEFIINFDHTGEQIWGSSYVKGTPPTNSGWDNGREKYTRYFRKNGEQFLLLKEIFNSYVQDSRRYVEVPSIVVRKKYNPPTNVDAVIVCTEADLTAATYLKKCQTTHTHFYAALWNNRWTCLASGASNQTVLWQRHPCNTPDEPKSEGDIVTAEYELDYLDAIEYKNISYWVYLDKTIETTYDQNGLNPVTTETKYFYDNEQHVQLSRVTTKGSDGKEQVVSMKYPHDYASNVSNITSLKNKHIVNIPIKSETSADGVQINGTVLIRNSKGQPEQVYNYEPDNVIPPVSHDTTELIPSADYKLKTTLGYDAETNNLFRIQLNNNLTTTYLWGYANTVPIAEIVNATAQRTSEIVNDSRPISSPRSETPVLLLDTWIINHEQDVTIAIDMAGVNPPYQGSQSIDVSLEVTNVATSAVNDFTLTFNSSVSHKEQILHLLPGEYIVTYTGVASSSDPSYNFIGEVFYKRTVVTSTVFHTSFEEDTELISSDSKTGSQSHAGAYSINLPKTAGNYIITYWERVNGEWSYKEIPQTIVTGNEGTIVLGSQGSLIDEVRLYPIGAKMTTYTYEPLIGVTSVTDANNVTTYYKYDAFGRLELVKDSDKNIVRQYKYHYKGEDQ